MFPLQAIATSLAVTSLVWERSAHWNSSTNPHHISDPVASDKVVSVVVGARGALAFDPDSLSAEKGAIIRFEFLGLNHTLTQSSLAHPCTNSSGFDTGFTQYNPRNESGKFLVDIEVQTRAPQWFFCAQTVPVSHCHAGMTFSLNPGKKQSDFEQNVRAQSVSKVEAAPSMCVFSPGRHTSASDEMSVQLTGTTGATGTSFPSPIASVILPEISNSGTGMRISFMLYGLCAVMAISALA